MNPEKLRRFMAAIPKMAQFRQAAETAFRIACIPWNGICKNVHTDLRSGSANMLWKFPLVAAMMQYPLGFYFHESKN